MSTLESPPRARRTEALSIEAIVDAAIRILDAGGEEALTFRALAAELHTGAGAIYHRVEHKQQLLQHAGERLIAPALRARSGEADDPRSAILRLMLATYDVFEAHRWAAAQLVDAPWQPVLFDLFGRLGELLAALGIEEQGCFDGASALTNQLLGVASLDAASVRLDGESDRTAFLTRITAAWSAREGATPAARRIVQGIADHDDRAQFLAGVRLLLAGITAQR